MTYTAATPILGTGTVSAEAINAWFRAEGPDYAPQYAPDRMYRPAPPTIGQDIIAVSQRWGINHDVMAAQILHESAAWQSRIVRDKNNPSGLGAVDDNAYAGAVTFPTPFEGIRATAAHLMTYAAGDGEWTQYDPRAHAVPSGNVGTVKTWGKLGGKWATDTGYGGRVVALANVLVTFANDGTWNMAGDDDRFTWMPDVSEFGYPQGARGRAGYSIDLGIIHYTQGTASSGWLRGNNGSSTHYLTDPLMRPFEQHVREADAAWTAGNREYNLRGINVEGELPGDQWTPDLIRELAKTTLPIWKRHTIPLVYLGKDNGRGKRGLIGHADVPDQDHTDPGKTFDWNLYIAELNRLNVDGNNPTADWPKVPPTIPDPWADSNPWGKTYWIPRVFVDRIRADGFMESGYAYTPAFAEKDKDGVTRVVQYFERARWELSQDGTITKGHVGIEAFNARYPGGAP